MPFIARVIVSDGVSIEVILKVENNVGDNCIVQAVWPRFCQFGQ